MKITEFDFSLPPGLVATRPANPRDQARLLVVGKVLDDRRVYELPDILRGGDVLVLNDTKVIPVQFFARRGVARVEVTLLRPIGSDTWTAFAKPGRRLRIGDELTLGDNFTCLVVERSKEGEFVLKFDRAGNQLMLAIESFGSMPLPPYIRKLRDVEPDDFKDYQTVYAVREGAIAAPTAGLHFTPELLQRLRDREIEIVCLTLHVGAGTFRPVSAENVAEHRMHSEWGELTAQTAARLNLAREEGRRIVAVGTTSLRLLESAADANGRLFPFCGETDIFITPGYAFKTADLLMTNFHLPRSTLFMLVCAFAGLQRMHKAYAHAIAKDYRFYSYGDATLLERAP